MFMLIISSIFYFVILLHYAIFIIRFFSSCQTIAYYTDHIKQISCTVN